MLQPRRIGETLRDGRLWLLCTGSSFYLVAQIALTGFVVLFLYDERGFSHGEAALVLAGRAGARGGVPDRRRALVGPGRLARGAAAAGRGREQRRRSALPPRSSARPPPCSWPRSCSPAASRWPGTGSRSRPRPSSRAGRGAAPRSGCSRRRLRRPEPSCRRSSRRSWARRRGAPAFGIAAVFPLARRPAAPAAQRLSVSAAPAASSTIPITRGQRQRDLVDAEEPEAVDHGAHRELPGDHDRDRRGNADPRAGEGDREDDQEPHRGAAPEPDRLRAASAIPPAP